MKTKIASIIILSVLFGGVVFAQEVDLPDPGLTPDSPFYFLETIAEGIGTLFTFGDLKKAERYTTLAAERLAEAEAMVEKEKPKAVEKALKRYEDQLEKALSRAEKAETKGKDTKEVAKTITEATYKHLIVLNEVLEKVPEEAKPAIERAMIVSAKEHKKAVDALKAKGALGEVPEGASLPTEIPEEIRETLRREVQKELEREEAERAKENGFQSFEVFKAKCLESGGPPEMCASFVNDLRNFGLFGAFCTERGALPPEMCEKIPLQGFESFEQLEDFCIGAGGTSEICASAFIETKCKEAGVTTPDECFLVLMTATVTTSPTASPARPLSELDCDYGDIDYSGEYWDGKTKWCCKDSDELYSPGYIERLHPGPPGSTPAPMDNYYYRKGTVEYKIINLADGTTEEGIERDSCDGDTLTEWMCPTRLDRVTRNERYSEEYDCPLGCEDGACIKEEAEEELRIPMEAQEDLRIHEEMSEE